MASLTVVSDTHLSTARPDAGRNWEAVLAHLDETRPDLVVHGGDISADGEDVIADLRHARAELERIPVPWQAVPGNHDLGDAARPADDPGAPTATSEWAMTQRRRTRFEELFGERFWTTTLDGWLVVGLDSQALLSGHADDESWWDWTAARLTTGEPTVVILHRPVAPTAPDEPDVDRRYLYDPHRSRFRQLLARSGTVELVVTGHTHQWRDQVVDGVRWVWAPSTWAVIDDEFQPVIGDKVVGLVEIELDERPGVAGRHVPSSPERDGPPSGPRVELVTPPGMVRHVAGGHRPVGWRGSSDGGR